MARSRGAKAQRYNDYSSSSDDDKHHRRGYSSDDSEVDSEDPDSDLERDRDRLVKIRQQRRAQAAEPSQGLSNSSVILYLGIAFIVCLSCLSAFAIYKYMNQADSDSGQDSSSSTVTIRETVTGGRGTATAGTGASRTDSKSSATDTANSSKGTGSVHSTFPGLSRNGIGFGFLPDYKDQKLSEIDEGLEIKSSFLGWYAQLPESGEWDGSQLLSELDEVVASGAIFQPAVMPNKHNWNGLTLDDNYQAQAIARVMKKFTSQGVEVWLRFAHEVNWYQTDGTYTGGVDEFKKAWAAVANAVKDDPLVRMWYTPNIASGTDQYEAYFPDDKSTVHIIGIDYYPRSSSESFLEHVQPWYDLRCKDGSILFAMAETGTMWKADIEEKLAWVDQLTSAETAKAMPNYVGATWFNYDKEQAFKLWQAGDTKNNERTRNWLKNDTVASGARMGGGTT